MTAMEHNEGGCRCSGPRDGSGGGCGSLRDPKPETRDPAAGLDPYLRCAFAGAGKTLAGVLDACLVLHSPQGCHALIGDGLASQRVDFSEAQVVSSKLCETEIVYGGEERLKETIREALVYGAPYLFVMSACGPEVVGDDLVAVCEAMSAECGVPVVPMECAGFRGNEHQGIDIALEKLLDFAAREALPKVPRSAALIAPHASANPGWPADLAWVRWVLGEMGVTVLSVLTHKQDVHGISQTPAAETSLLLSHDAGARTSARLSERFGVEPLCAELPLPIGLTNTQRWVEALGRRFDAEGIAARIVEEGHRNVIRAIRLRGPNIEFYHRVEAAIAADATLGIPFLRFITEDLEGIPSALLLRSCSEAAREVLARELEDLDLTPEVVIGADAYAMKQGLRRAHPDCVFGSMLEWQLGRELGIPYCFRVVSPTSRFQMTDRPYFGYDGLINLLEILQNEHQDRWRSRTRRYEAKW
jgi:nitrogenase molybdenum-iron protein alpha/beta subunit